MTDLILSALIIGGGLALAVFLGITLGKDKSKEPVVRS
jgi:hypothetical protein